MLSTGVDLKKFQALLEKKAWELEKELNNPEGLQASQEPDAIDATQRVQNTLEVAVNLTRNSETLSAVRAALDRLKERNFGVCVSCEGQISEKRLKAVPWAANCIKCQNQIDRAGETEAAKIAFA